MMARCLTPPNKLPNLLLNDEGSPVLLKCRVFFLPLRLFAWLDDNRQGDHHDLRQKGKKGR